MNFIPILFSFAAAAQTTAHQHYDHAHPPPQGYDSYGRVAHSAGGPDGEQTPSGTPSTSVHSSPGRHPGINNIQVFVFKLILASLGVSAALYLNCCGYLWKCVCEDELLSPDHLTCLKASPFSFV